MSRAKEIANPAGSKRPAVDLKRSSSVFGSDGTQNSQKRPKVIPCSHPTELIPVDSSAFLTATRIKVQPLSRQSDIKSSSIVVSHSTAKSSNDSRLLLLQRLVREISTGSDLAGIDSEIVDAISRLDCAFRTTKNQFSSKDSSIAGEVPISRHPDHSSSL